MFLKLKKIVLPILCLIVLAIVCLTLPMSSQARVRFGGFDAYGGQVISYYNYMGTEWLLYKQYETDGYSISTSMGLLNVNATLMKGPCKMTGASLLGFGKGFGTGYGSAGVAMVLWCTPLGVVE